MTDIWITGIIIGAVSITLWIWGIRVSTNSVATHIADYPLTFRTSVWGHVVGLGYFSFSALFAAAPHLIGKEEFTAYGFVYTCSGVFFLIGVYSLISSIKTKVLVYEDRVEIYGLKKTKIVQQDEIDRVNVMNGRITLVGPDKKIRNMTSMTAIFSNTRLLVSHLNRLARQSTPSENT